MNQNSNNVETIASTNKSDTKEENCKLTNGELALPSKRKSSEEESASHGTPRQSHYSSDTGSLKEESFTSNDENTDYHDKNGKSISPLTALNFPPPPPDEDEDCEELEEKNGSKVDFHEALISNLANFMVKQAISEVVLVESIVVSAINDAIFSVNRKEPISTVISDENSNEEVGVNAEESEKCNSTETTPIEDECHDDILTTQTSKSEKTATLPNSPVPEVESTSDVAENGEPKDDCQSEPKKSKSETTCESNSLSDAHLKSDGENETATEPQPISPPPATATSEKPGKNDSEEVTLSQEQPNETSSDKDETQLSSNEPKQGLHLCIDDEPQNKESQPKEQIIPFIEQTSQQARNENSISEPGALDKTDSNSKKGCCVLL